MYKRKTFAFVADPVFKQPVVVKSFEPVNDPAYKPKYTKHKPKIAVDIIRPISHVPLPEGIAMPTPMRSLPESPDISFARVVSRTPSSSSLVSGVIVPKPKPTPVPEVIRVVPEPEPIPEPELPVGSRAWRIKQFIKANFKS